LRTLILGQPLSVRTAARASLQTGSDTRSMPLQLPAPPFYPSVFSVLSVISDVKNKQILLTEKTK
jgi:hypothetical protein